MKTVFKTFINGMKEVAQSLPQDYKMSDESFDKWYSALVDYYNYYNYYTENSDRSNQSNRNNQRNGAFLDWYGLLVTSFYHDSKKLTQVLNKLEADILSVNPKDTTALQIYDTFLMIARYNY